MTLIFFVFLEILAELAVFVHLSHSASLFFTAIFFGHWTMAFSIFTKFMLFAKCWFKFKIFLTHLMTKKLFKKKSWELLLGLVNMVNQQFREFHSRNSKKNHTGYLLLIVANYF
jgi:hypothetical protein